MGSTPSTRAADPSVCVRQNQRSTNWFNERADRPLGCLPTGKHSGRNMERGRERELFWKVSERSFKRGREGESKQMSREKRLKKHSCSCCPVSPSVLRRQKGAKWVIIVFYTDKDRGGRGKGAWVWVLDTSYRVTG